MMAKKAPERLVKPAHTARRTGEDPRVAKLLASLRVDPDLAPIVDAFEENAKATGRRSFGSNGLKVNGKLFALFTQRTLVVKLPKDRAIALVASNVGEPFDPGHGRLMREWLTVVDPKASWIDLAREAYEFVRG
jgi:hypothetical protein